MYKLICKKGTGNLPRELNARVSRPIRALPSAQILCKLLLFILMSITAHVRSKLLKSAVLLLQQIDVKFLEIVSKFQSLVLKV